MNETFGLAGINRLFFDRGCKYQSDEDFKQEKLVTML
jgi:hypothetical protein